MKLDDAEEWTVRNEDSQYHDFHIHQTGFLVTEGNGEPAEFDGLRDTHSVPPARNGKRGEAKLLIPFTNPEIVAVRIPLPRRRARRQRHDDGD